MAKQQKKVVSENKANLFNMNKPLYDLITHYGISHLYLAEQLYPADWAKADSELDLEKRNKDKKTLTGRLRNKLDGRGVISSTEVTDLINIFSEMADSMKSSVLEARAIRKEQRNEKIRKLLEGMDEDTIEELRKSL